MERDMRIVLRRHDWTVSISLLILLAISVVVAFVGVRVFSGPDDGIQLGKNYKLAASYRAQIEMSPGKTIPGRVFDFADRNMPRSSIAVPTQDERGVTLVKLNTTLPPSTVRKSRVSVPKRVIEDVVYPAYEYVLWEYNLATVEVQGIDPPVIPRR